MRTEGPMRTRHVSGIFIVNVIRDQFIINDEWGQVLHFQLSRGSQQKSSLQLTFFYYLKYH